MSKSITLEQFLKGLIQNGLFRFTPADCKLVWDLSLPMLQTAVTHLVVHMRQKGTFCKEDYERFLVDPEHYTNVVLSAEIATIPDNILPLFIKVVSHNSAIVVNRLNTDLKTD